MRASLPLTIAAAVGLAGASQAQAQVHDGYDGTNEPYYDAQVDGDSYVNDDYDDGDYDNGAYDDGAYAELGDDSYADDGEPYDASDVAAADTFRDRLSPYGRWVNTPEYGMVWIPNSSQVGSDFVPYSTRGTWSYSNAGWTFDSDFAWGSTAFHYGRWYFDVNLAVWVWVPGRTWAPAWVDWRFGGGYVGWAPLPPRGRYADYDDARTRWCFTPARYLGSRHVHRYVVRDRRYYTMTSPVRRPLRSGRTVWYAGPRVDRVERVARTRFHRVRARDVRAERRIDRPDRRQQDRRMDRQADRIQRQRQELRQDRRQDQRWRQQQQRQQQQRRQEQRQHLQQAEHRQLREQQVARRQQVERRQQVARHQQVERRQQRQQQVERRQQRAERRPQVARRIDQRQAQRDRPRDRGNGRERRRRQRD